jgi:beta-phosphoglucomutase-like phosphatase (HAD superfamily)
MRNDKELLRRCRNQTRDTLVTVLTTPISGSIDFLRSARARGLKIGMVTQTNYASVQLLEDKAVLPKGLFDTIVACGSDDRLRKVSPSLVKKSVAFALACEALGVAPAQSLAIEDSPEGLRAARQAGLVCLGLARPGTPHNLSADADIVVTDLGPNVRPEVMDVLVSARPAEIIVRLKEVLR